MQSAEIREKFLKFFEKKGHKRVLSSSLVPENDSSVLFTTAGMQQFKPYYVGKLDALKDFGSLNTVSVQKCLRTSDIEEVGDERHLTFFEMLGNFSFGGYWKKEAIEYAHEFVTKEMNLKIDYVTVFEGETGVPKDTESETIWKSIDKNFEVRKYGRADNFWGPTGVEGPCGPTTEIYVDGIEIWNIVFNEFYQNKDKTLKPLEVKGIDTGMGLERLAKVVQKVPTVFETDLFKHLFSTLPERLDEKKKRILADHARAISFLITDGVSPDNKGAGYILRRLLRRILAQFEPDEIKLALDHTTAKFLELDKSKIWEIVGTEQSQFIVALNLGKKELNKLTAITPELAFRLFNSYGLPLDVIRDKFPELNISNFEKEFEKHQEVSRAGVEQKFKGGLAGHSEMEVKYHTTTHLLHQALREVLGKDVFQKGSNITVERLRFDFSFPRKMTDEEKKKVEDLVNEKIKESLPVSFEDIPMAEAKKRGAIGLFEEKYGDKVRVYKVGNFSLEFCGGPHVENTSTLGKFKIVKEEAVSVGVRRIKAILE
ncbi:MAG: alanine--tRNA ligase [Patescibacteria group bacterium]|mgnify:CR=1 FL=1